MQMLVQITTASFPRTSAQISCILTKIIRDFLGVSMQMLVQITAASFQVFSSSSQSPYHSMLQSTIKAVQRP
jgi:hypothetical protein